MTEARKERVLDLRNAIFEVADGCTLDEVMQAITMAQTRMVAEMVNGDEFKTHSILERYREMQTASVQIYCSEVMQSAAAAVVANGAND